MAAASEKCPGGQPCKGGKQQGSTPDAAVKNSLAFCIEGELKLRKLDDGNVVVYYFVVVL